MSQRIEDFISILIAIKEGGPFIDPTAEQIQRLRNNAEKRICMRRGVVQTTIKDSYTRKLGQGAAELVDQSIVEWLKGVPSQLRELLEGLATDDEDKSKIRTFLASAEQESVGSERISLSREFSQCLAADIEDNSRLEDLLSLSICPTGESCGRALHLTPFHVMTLERFLDCLYFVAFPPAEPHLQQWSAWLRIAIQHRARQLWPEILAGQSVTFHLSQPELQTLDACLKHVTHDVKAMDHVNSWSVHIDDLKVVLSEKSSPSPENREPDWRQPVVRNGECGIRLNPVQCSEFREFLAIISVGSLVNGDVCGMGFYSYDLYIVGNYQLDLIAQQSNCQSNDDNFLIVITRPQATLLQHCFKCWPPDDEWDLSQDHAQKISRIRQIIMTQLSSGTTHPMEASEVTRAQESRREGTEYRRDGETDDEGKADEYERNFVGHSGSGDRENCLSEPGGLRDILGQRDVIARLRIAIDAARISQETLGHILLEGPLGLGKRTLAIAIGRELQVGVQITSALGLSAPRDLIHFLTNTEAHSILVIEEIHRLPKAVEEFLYPAMEDSQLDIPLGEGVNARTINMPLQPFTLIGTTTRSEQISLALRDRFKVCERLCFYKNQELAEFVRQRSDALCLPIDDVAALEIARRSRGSPYFADKRLRWVRDYVIARGEGQVTQSLAQEALAMQEIDQYGLDALDKSYLQTVLRCQEASINPEKIAHLMNASLDVIVAVIEPYLVHVGLAERTARGWKVTSAGRKYLSEPLPSSNMVDES